MIIRLLVLKVYTRYPMTVQSLCAWGSVCILASQLDKMAENKQKYKQEIQQVRNLPFHIATFRLENHDRHSYRYEEEKSFLDSKSFEVIFPIISFKIGPKAVMLGRHNNASLSCHMAWENIFDG